MGSHKEEAQSVKAAAIAQAEEGMRYERERNNSKIKSEINEIEDQILALKLKVYELAKGIK